MKEIMAFMLILVSAQTAHADQCASVTADIAATAVKMADTQSVGKLLEFCQPCGDTAPQEVAIKSVALTPDTYAPVPGLESFNMEVTVNGNPVDLAR